MQPDGPGIDGACDPAVHVHTNLTLIITGPKNSGIPNTLETAASVKKLVAFYVEQHNSHLPHSAFKGQTPDEMYFGTGDGIPKKLEEAKLQARELRLKSNRERNCHVCALPTPASC